MTSREETLRKIEEFNKRVEQARQEPPKPGEIPTAGTANVTSQEQKNILDVPNGNLSSADLVEKKALQTEQELKREQLAREQQENKREQDERSNVQRMQDAGKRASNAALDAAEPPIRWLERVPTPYGLGAILAIIILFLLAVVPVDSSGNTRLKLIWLTISGKTHLLYQDQDAIFGGAQQQSSTTSGGSSQLTSGSGQPQVVPIEIPDLAGIDFTNL